MNLTLDNILVALAILGALAFLARGFFRGKKKGCSTGCGCDAGKISKGHFETPQR